MEWYRHCRFLAALGIVDVRHFVDIFEQSRVAGDFRRIDDGLCACGEGRGRGIVGKNNKTAEHSPGEEGAQEMLDAGNDFLGEALPQVLVGGHEGGEADFGAYLADESKIIGGRPAFGFCDGPFQAIFFGHGPEADYGYFEGELAAEGVDARPDVG